MAKKTYKTAQGKIVDLGALQLQNETVRAVGNMGVNARGDKLNSKNKSIDSRNASIRRHYKKQTRTNVSNDEVVDTSIRANQFESSVSNDAIVQPQAVAEDPAVESSNGIGGLADAIAKAKQNDSEV